MKQSSHPKEIEKQRLDIPHPNLLDGPACLKEFMRALLEVESCFGRLGGGCYGSFTAVARQPADIPNRAGRITVVLQQRSQMTRQVRKVQRKASENKER